MVIYIGQLVGVFISIYIQFVCYSHFGPIATIFGFVVGCYIGYIFHVQKHTHARNRSFRWKISKYTCILWGVLFFVTYGTYIVIQSQYKIEHLFILPILSVFLGGGSGILAAIVGDCIPLIYEDQDNFR